MGKCVGKLIRFDINTVDFTIGNLYLIWYVIVLDSEG